MTDEHYKALFERELADKNQMKAWLFDAWKTRREQQKGMKRQRKLIRRLQAENAELNKYRELCEELVEALRSIRDGKDNPCWIVECALAKAKEKLGGVGK